MEVWNCLECFHPPKEKKGANIARANEINLSYFLVSWKWTWKWLIEKIESIGRLIQSINQLANQSTNEPLNQSINQAINQSVDRSINQSNKETANQSINSSNNQQDSDSSPTSTSKSPEIIECFHPSLFLCVDFPGQSNLGISRSPRLCLTRAGWLTGRLMPRMPCHTC